MEAHDPTQPLEIDVSEEDGVRRLRLRGELDMAGYERFEKLLTDPEGADTFVLDLRGLTFIDSSGLLALINADKRARADGGRLVVVRGPDRVNAVLEVTGVAREIELVDQPPSTKERGVSSG